jgi:hypothetical protein
VRTLQNPECQTLVYVTRFFKTQTEALMVIGTLLPPLRGFWKGVLIEVMTVFYLFSNSGPVIFQAFCFLVAGCFGFASGQSFKEGENRSFRV